MIRFGVNYVPRKNWFFSWDHPDLKETEEDFFVIQSMGFDHIRLHLRWDKFQYSDHAVDQESIGILKQMLDLAKKAKLDVQVTVFNGWMSGLWFLPAFLRGRHIITDRSVAEAQSYFLEELAKEIADHPKLLGLDLGNEINVFDFLQQPFSPEAGNIWLKEKLRECEVRFPGKFHVVGVDHNPWFGRQAFSREVLANTGSATSLHTWVGFTGALQKFGNLSRETLSLAEYNIEFANAYAKERNRPVWIQEFGAPVSWYSTLNEAARYARETVLSAMRSENLWGFTWWCSHDIDRSLDTFDPLEYDLGLIGRDNKIKPLGKVVAELIREVRSGMAPEPLVSDKGIVIEQGKVNGLEYLAAYAKLLSKGEHAKFVLSERAEEAKRNGRDLIWLGRN